MTVLDNSKYLLSDDIVLNNISPDYYTVTVKDRYLNIVTLLCDCTGLVENIKEKTYTILKSNCIYDKNGLKIMSDYDYRNDR